MFAKELQAFKERHKIKSADEWATVSGVSKSTIVRGLKGEGKDMGVNTLLELIEPYGESLDQVLNIGSYTPNEVKKNEITEKIESVMDEIENSEIIPEEPAQEIKETLEEVHQFINESVEEPKCPVCGILRENIAEMKEDKSTKDKWLLKLFGISFLLIAVVLVMLIIITILSLSLSEALHS